MTLEELLRRLRVELGVTTSGPAPALSPSLPQVLADFYSVVDGLRLPFLEIASAVEVSPFQARRAEPPAWLQFGTDGYFTWYLCSLDPAATVPIAAWDHEAGVPIEPTLGSVSALIEEEYDRVLSRGWRAHVVVDSMPSGLPIAKLVACIKSDAGGSSATLLSLLRKPKFKLRNLRVATATTLCASVNSSGGIARVHRVGPPDGGAD